MSILGKEDPFMKVGAVNDRSKAADSEYVWALKGIDFKVEQGDVVGIIGKNGAGKSTLLKLLSKVTGPTTGTIRARGRIASLLEVGTGFHSELTGRENIYMNGTILGMTKREINSKIDEIVDFSGCERYIDTPVKRYSSGMTVRLGFAVAAHLDPEILVVDEVLAVGDAEFQKKAIGKMQDVSKGEGRTVLFVSHNMASIRALCKNGVLLENGSVKYTGLIDEVVGYYLNDNETNQTGVPLIERKDRKGNGNARFSEFVLLVDGKKRTSFSMGSSIKFRMCIDSTRKLESVDVMYSIYNSFGVLVTSSNSRFASAEQLGLKEGENWIEVDYQNLPLAPGMYKVNIRVWDQYERDLDWVENAFSFEIVESDVFGTGRYYKNSSSIVVVPHKWVKS